MNAHKVFCMDYIFPAMVEKIWWKPNIRLFIVESEALFEWFYTHIRHLLNEERQDPSKCGGFTIRKQLIYLKDDPTTIAYSFVHELLHCFYPDKKEEEIRMLGNSVFYEIIPQIMGQEKAQEFLKTIGNPR